jgi:hypothetical protein
VDCFGTIYGLIEKVSKGDETASIFIHAVYQVPVPVCSLLSCGIHMEHLSRMSDFGTKVSDRLSLLSSSTLPDSKPI